MQHAVSYVDYVTQGFESNFLTRVLHAPHKNEWPVDKEEVDRDTVILSNLHGLSLKVIETRFEVYTFIVSLGSILCTDFRSTRKTFLFINYLHASTPLCS